MNNSNTTNISFNLFYNIIPSIIILIVVSLICLYRKKYIMPIVFGFQLLKVVLIIITAPDCFFMYYLPIYMTGYTILALIIANHINSKKQNTQNNVLI